MYLGEEDKEGKQFGSSVENSEERNVTLRPRPHDLFPAVLRQLSEAPKVGESGGEAGHSAEDEGAVPCRQSPQCYFHQPLLRMLHPRAYQPA